MHTTHTPLVYHKDAHLGYFIGHIDKFNPQMEHLLEGGPITVLFHGPETYISPSVYQSTQLPTWNYFKAHFDGSVGIPTTTSNRQFGRNDYKIRRPQWRVSTGGR